jgi:hypothetical protein
MSLIPSARLARWRGFCGRAASCSSRSCNYFYQGPLTETWTFGAAPARMRDTYQPFTITYARRTLAGWLTAVLGTGLAIEAIEEPCADQQTAAAHPQVADTRIAPYFLIVRARKPVGIPVRHC